MATTFNTIPTKRLAATISGSSGFIKLNNILGWDGATLTTADVGDVLYAVLRDQDNSVMEIMQLDTSTIANNSTTGITILRRGLKFNGDLTTEVPANKLVWVKNQTIVEIGTDVPQIFQNFVNFTDAQNVGGVKTFTSLPATTAGNPISANDLARKAYVDSVVAGIATSVSNVVPGTAGETIVAGNLVYLKLADSRWWKTDADTAATVEGVLLGIAQGSGTAGNTITNGVMTRGVDANQSGLSAGSVYYASNTAGAISSSVGTVEVTVGVAKSTTELYFDPRFNQQLTEDQQDALAGTSGTPSASNKYVTNADTTGTGSVLRQSAVGGYGDGSDGSGTLDGSTTVFGLVPAGNVYTMTRDLYCIDLTINTGVTLNPNGYRLFGTGTLTGNGTAKIARNGANGATGINGINGSNGSAAAGGTGATATSGLSAGSISGSLGGSAGGNGGASSNGTIAGIAGSAGTSASTLTNSVGSGSPSASNGVAGVNSTINGGGATTGASSNTVTNPPMMPRTAEWAMLLHYFSGGTVGYMAGSNLATGGTGGGGGGATSGGGGGGGGGGGAGGGCGGLVCVAFKTIVSPANNFIQALGGTGGAGGTGGNPSAGAGGTGGSGGTGGTGGVVCIVYKTMTGTTITTASVAGGTGGSAGAGGTGGNAGNAGTTGGTGKLYLVNM